MSLPAFVLRPIRGLQAAFDANIRPAPPTFSKSLGMALLFAFGLQILTGITLAAHYAPTPTDAWGSLHQLEHHTLFGSFVRGLHHFGSSAVVVLSVLHLTQALMTGAYRRPRHKNWLLGVVMLFLVLGLGLTGYLLPWDQHGYWSTRVATGIIGEAPFGGLLQTLLLGGSDYGNATLSRFYGLHAFVLPGLLAVMTVFHVRAYFRHGPKHADVPPADAPGPDAATPSPRPALPYFPFQLIRDVIVMTLVFALLAALALALGARLEAPADPASDFEARPEWYFLFLYQLLQFFEGPMVFVGTTLIPALAAVFLLAVPFIDREREPKAPGATRFPRAKIVKLVHLGLLAAVGGLTTYAIVSDQSDSRYQKSREKADREAALATRLADQGGVDGLGRVTLYEGLKLYHDKGCASCHDDPKVPSPRLKGYGSLERALAFLDAPDGERFFKGTPLEGLMEPTKLGKDDNTAVANWLMGRPQAADRTERAKKLFVDSDCTTCHNEPGMDPRKKGYDFRIAGPDLDGWQSYEWTRDLLRNASHPRFFGGSLADKDLENAMPAYPDLSPDELDLLTTWLVAGAPEAL